MEMVATADEEYFAGMLHHFEQVYDLMAEGGKAAYVVGDSGSYWQVEVETAEILAELAEERVGFEDSQIRLWRNMAATTADTVGRKTVKNFGTSGCRISSDDYVRQYDYDDVEENILILTKPEE